MSRLKVALHTYIQPGMASFVNPLTQKMSEVLLERDGRKSGWSGRACVRALATPHTKALQLERDSWQRSGEVYGKNTPQAWHGSQHAQKLGGNNSQDNPSPVGIKNHRYFSRITHGQVGVLLPLTP